MKRTLIGRRGVLGVAGAFILPAAAVRAQGAGVALVIGNSRFRPRVFTWSRGASAPSAVAPCRGGPAAVRVSGRTLPAGGGSWRRRSLPVAYPRAAPCSEASVRRARVRAAAVPATWSFRAGRPPGRGREGFRPQSFQTRSSSRPCRPSGAASVAWRLPGQPRAARQGHGQGGQNDDRTPVRLVRIDGYWCWGSTHLRSRRGTLSRSDYANLTGSCRFATGR